MPRKDSLSTLIALGHRKMSEAEAILAKCNWCSRSREDRIDCLVRDCPLYPFRLGKSPWRKPKSSAQLAAARRLTARRHELRSLRPSESVTDGFGGSPPQDAAAEQPTYSW